MVWQILENIFLWPLVSRTPFLLNNSFLLSPHTTFVNHIFIFEKITETLMDLFYLLGMYNE